MTKPFNPLQAVILEKLAEALFLDVIMVIPPRQVVANLQVQFAMVAGNKPREIGLTLYLVCLVLGGPVFLLASPAWRARRIAARLQRGTNNLLQDLARIRGVIYAGYYGHWEGRSEDDNVANPVFAQIGFTLPKHRVRGPGEVAILPFPGRDLTQADLVQAGAIPAEVDIVVIGSGAGGAVAAANLAAQGHDVLVIEAGPLFASSDLTHEERRMTARLYADGGLQSTRDHDIILFQGRCVGGSTVINNGICLRVNEAGATHPAADDVLARWASLGAPVDVARFHDAYDAVAARLSVAPVDPRSGRANGPHLTRGWAGYVAAGSDPMAAQAPATWFSKNFGPAQVGATCAYCGYCNTGCPYGRKQGTAQSFLLDARRDGARILADTSVDRIIWRGGDAPRRADGVSVVSADGGTRTVRARRGVVVAAGALASSRILARSGIAGTGRGISLNIACPVVALMPGPMRSWDEDQMTTYVDCGDFLLESHFQPPMSMATLMPGWFADHAARMTNYTRLASAGVLIPADRRGHLVNNGGMSLKLRPDVELALLRRALATLCKVHFAAGALEVYPALARGQVLYPDQDVDAFFAAALREADDVTLSSSHPHGGNARHADPSKGVVDLDCRVHGTTNVLVTDASTFTSCIRVNAQLTTMAMAHYATAASPF